MKSLIFRYISASLILSLLSNACIPIIKQDYLITKDVYKNPKNVTEKLKSTYYEMKTAENGNQIIISIQKNDSYVKEGDIKKKRYRVTERTWPTYGYWGWAILIIPIPFLIIASFRAIDTKILESTFIEKSEIPNWFRKVNQAAINTTISISVDGKLFNKYTTNDKGEVVIDLDKLLPFCVQNKNFDITIEPPNNIKLHVQIEPFYNVKQHNIYKKYLALLAIEEARIKNEQIKKDKDKSARIQYYRNIGIPNNVKQIDGITSWLQQKESQETDSDVIDSIKDKISQLSNKKNDITARPSSNTDYSGTWYTPRIRNGRYECLTANNVNGKDFSPSRTAQLFPACSEFGYNQSKGLLVLDCTNTEIGFKIAYFRSYAVCMLHESLYRKLSNQ